MYIPINDIKYLMNNIRNMRIKGATDDDLKKCYLILFNNLSIYYRNKKNIKE